VCYFIFLSSHLKTVCGILMTKCVVCFCEVVTEELGRSIREHSYNIKGYVPKKDTALCCQIYNMHVLSL
jgi:hypothetical protein